MGSANLTDAIKFDTFKTGLEKYVTLVNDQMDFYDKAVQTFFEQMSQVWMSEIAVKRYKPMSIMATGHSEAFGKSCNILLTDIYSVGKGWADGLSDSQEGSITIPAMPDLFPETKTEVVEWKTEDEYGAKGMNDKAALMILDNFKQACTDHEEAFNEVLNIDFGIKDSTNSITEELQQACKNLKITLDARVTNLEMYITKSIEDEVINLELGADLAKKLMEDKVLAEQAAQEALATETIQVTNTPAPTEQ